MTNGTILILPLENFCFCHITFLSFPSRGMTYKYQSACHSRLRFDGRVVFVVGYIGQYLEFQ